jgi:ABC-type phosphate transport system substrate-binding protein
MHRRTLLALALGAIALVGTTRRAEAQEFKVVVNASAAVTELPAATVSKLFLKQERKFPSGSAVVPVDLGKASPVRGAFTRVVHTRAVGAVEQYWQQQLFSGRDTPPETKATDDDVLAFVKSTPGAIGYVSASATIPSGVSVITVK